MKQEAVPMSPRITQLVASKRKFDLWVDWLLWWLMVLL